MKPILAVDADLDNLKFPLIAMPKIDGVRGLNVDGKLVARSLKPFKNKALTTLLSTPEFAGFDGELVAGNVTDADLCRRTTSLTGTIKGNSDVGWCLFDYVPNDSVAELPYEERYNLLEEQLFEIKQTNAFISKNLWLVPMFVCSDIETLLALENNWLMQGYEGVICRSMDGKYKYGRTTKKEATYLRIKRFIDGEAEVLELIEGETNTNEAQVNELGDTYRTSHQAGKVLNGMLASMNCRMLKDVKDPQTKKVLLKKDQVVVVTAGKMNHEQRKYFFENPEVIIERIVKFQFFPKGQKDKPRFPTFQTFRDPVDM